MTIQVPSGEFVTGPGDLVVVRTDGDLEYRPNALAPAPSNRAEPILLLDNPDPRVEPEEGPGPNLVDDVAGVVNGSVIYGDCCEPVSGNIFAIDIPEADRGPIAVGFHPNLSPDGTRLVAGNSMGLNSFDLSAGDGIAISRNQDPEQSFRSLRDIEWIDHDTFITVSRTADDSTRSLIRYDATTLAESGSVELPDFADLDQARFAGRTPDGLIGLAVTGPDLSTVRYFDPDTLEENTDLTQTFPPPVAAVEIDAGGLGQIWVDRTTANGRLFYLPPGSFEARLLGDGIRAAWFVNTP